MLLSESFITWMLCLSPGDSMIVQPCSKASLINFIDCWWKCSVFFFLNALVYPANQRHNRNTFASLHEAWRTSFAFKCLGEWLVWFQVFSLLEWRVKISTAQALMVFLWLLAICYGEETFPAGIHALANFCHHCHINSAFSCHLSVPINGFWIDSCHQNA